MSHWERQHYSLAARVFHSVIIGSAVLGLVALLIGLGAYIYAMTNQYVRESFSLSKSAGAILERSVNTDSLVRDVMRIYREMTEEERQEVDTDAYSERFSHITSRSDYLYLRELLEDFLESSNVSDLYLGVYDPDTKALVYICDPDKNEETWCAPGYWEPLSSRELNRFLNWKGEAKLYDISNTEDYGWMCTSGVPFPHPDESIRLFVLADVTLQDLGKALKYYVIQYSAALAFFTVILGILMTRHMKKTLVQPINAIADAARNYVNDRRNSMDTTDHFSRLNIRTGDEIENLSLTFADMEQDLSEYEKHLTVITAEKERIHTELSLATRLQAAMLPNIFPAFPERVDFDIYARMRPAKEVGGDFYDFFLIDEDHLAMVMADVSGKGVPAALFMMATKIMIANLAMVGRSPKEVLQDANNAICKNNREEMFVTVWFGILEISTGRVTAANAGHEYPILKQPDGRFELFRDKHGFVVGHMEGLRYQEYELNLSPGAKLFLYTDGVTEATDRDSRMFGTERLTDVLNEAASGKPEQILTKVEDAVDTFVGDAPQFDDLTMLCLEYRGRGNGEG